MVKGYKRKYPRLYKIWIGLKARCNNPNDKDYMKYGGRGIKVCKDWQENPQSFIEWALANGYANNLSIDRIDVNKGYSPDNCRWADAVTQTRNRRVEKTNKLGVKGVYYEKDRNKYRVTIGLDGKQIKIGRYDTLEEAKEARRKAELQYW